MSLPPRKSEEDVMIKFSKSQEGVCVEAVAQKFRRIHKKTPMAVSFCEGTSLVKILHSCRFNIFGINCRCLRQMPIKKKNNE